MYLRATRKTRSEVSLFEPVGTDREGNDISLVEVLGTEPDAVSEEVETEVARSRLGTLLRRLDPREREVIELRFGLRTGTERTQREVARFLGISRSYVSRIEKRAVKKLAREWEHGTTGERRRNVGGA